MKSFLCLVISASVAMFAPVALADTKPSVSNSASAAKSKRSIAVIYKAETKSAAKRTERSVQRALKSVERAFVRYGYSVVQPKPEVYRILDQGPSVVVTFDRGAGLTLLLSAEVSSRAANTPERVYAEVVLSARVMLGSEVVAPEFAEGRIEARKTSLERGYAAAADRAAKKLTRQIQATIKDIPPEKFAALTQPPGKIDSAVVLAPEVLKPKPPKPQPRPDPTPKPKPRNPPVVTGPDATNNCKPVPSDRAQRPTPRTPPKPDGSAGVPIQAPQESGTNAPGSSAAAPIAVPGGSDTAANKPSSSAATPIEVPGRERPNSSAGVPITASASKSLGGKAAEPCGLPRPAKVHGLVIGVWDFSIVRENGMRGAGDLASVKNDVEAITGALRDLGAASKDVVVLANRQATTDSVRQALRNAVSKVGPEDLFVMYISSHGVPKDNGTTAFGRPVLSDYSRDASGLIDFWEIQSLLKGLPTNRILWIVDTCHAGGATLGLQNVAIGAGSGSIEVRKLSFFDPSVAARHANAQQHFAVLSSSMPDQVSFAGTGPSRFTKVLVESMSTLRNGGDTIGNVFRQQVQPGVTRETRRLCADKKRCNDYDAQYPVLGVAGRGYYIRF